MPNVNKSIKCSIENCKHQEANYCKLDNICVGSDCDCKNKKETQCKSFELGI